MLQTLAGSGLHDVAAVVVRWYGGTNLGIGGLVRAYSGALALALADAPVRHGDARGAPVGPLRPRPDVGRCCARSRRSPAAISSTPTTTPSTCTFMLPAAAAARFREALRDATHGALECGRRRGRR